VQRLVLQNCRAPLSPFPDQVLSLFFLFHPSLASDFFSPDDALAPFARRQPLASSVDARAVGVSPLLDG